jgi:hypothetical protein
VVFGDSVFGICDVGLFEQRVPVLSDKESGDVLLKLYFEGLTFRHDFNVFRFVLSSFFLQQPCKSGMIGSHVFTPVY